MIISAEFCELQSEIEVQFDEVHEVTKIFDEVYDGACTVVPQTCDQVLQTKYKFMTDDVTVNAIPTYETSNTAGGTTFTIA